MLFRVILLLDVILYLILESNLHTILTKPLKLLYRHFNDVMLSRDSEDPDLL